MFESLNKLMLAGLGALSMTRERAEKIFDEYVAKGQEEKERRTGFVKEMMDSAEKTRENLEKIVGEQVQQAVSRLHLATHEDLQRVEAKLDQLLNQEQ